MDTYDTLYEEIMSEDRQALLHLTWDEDKIRLRDFIVLRLREVEQFEKDLLNDWHGYVW